MKILHISFLLFVFSISAFSQTPVLFSLQSLTGTVNNRQILVQPDRVNNPLVFGTNLVPMFDFTLQPVNGQVITNLQPWGYTITVNGWPRSAHIVVPNTTNILNVVSLINTNQFAPLNFYNLFEAGSGIFFSADTNTGETAINMSTNTAFATNAAYAAAAKFATNAGAILDTNIVESAGAGSGITIGYNNSDFNAYPSLSFLDSITIGDNNSPSTNSYILGSSCTPGGQWDICLGYGAFTGPDSSGSQSDSNVAIGYTSFALGSQAVAIGEEARAFGQNGLALGSFALSTSNATAIGSGSTASGWYSIGIGGGSASAQYAIAIGLLASSGLTNSVEIGNGNAVSNGWLHYNGAPIIDPKGHLGAASLTNLSGSWIHTTNAPINGYALRYTNGGFYWAP